MDISVYMTYKIKSESQWLWFHTWVLLANTKLFQIVYSTAAFRRNTTSSFVYDILCSVDIFA